MKAMIYVTKRSMINKIKAAMKKPITFFYLILGIAYFAFILYGGSIWIQNMRLTSLSGFILILTVWTFFMFLSNFVTYAKRKGILFKASHTQFIFTAPISPKAVLLYTAGKNFILSFLVSILFTIGGITVFEVPAGKMVLFFLVSFVLEVIFEASLVIVLYGNEKISAQMISVLCKMIYAFIISVVLFLGAYFYVKGFTIENAMNLVDFTPLQMIPVVGWNVAAFRLVLLGPTIVNVVCTVLYIGIVMVMLFIAFKMECFGGYYEDAAKFANDYAEAKARSKQGEATFSIGKKKQFKNIKMDYHATGAKAIFYRQVLEYKKEKFFIFGMSSVICAGITFVSIKFLGEPTKVSPSFYLLGILVYIVFLTSAYSGKWEKELQNPYLFLIPDHARKKLWYATAMEHIKALIDASIIVIPITIAWKLPIIHALCSIAVFVVLQANKLYMKVLLEALIGDSFSKTIKGIIQMVTQLSIMLIGIAAAAIAGIFISFNLVFPIILIYSMIVTVMIALLAATRFETMEQLG